MPLMLIIQVVLDQMGIKMQVGWGEPFVSVWLGSGTLAIVLGLWNKGERSQGALIIPILFAAAVTTFFLGDIIVPG